MSSHRLAARRCLDRVSIFEPMRPRRALLAIATAVGAGILLVGQSRASTLYWDGDGAGATGNPPTAGTGGSGTWDNSTSANWFNGSTYQLWTAAGGQDIAEFGGTAGTVTIASGTTVNANQLTFDTDGYIILGGTAGDASTIPVTQPTINSTLNLNGAATVITNVGTALFSGYLTGSNGLNVTGAGVFNLAGVTQPTVTTGSQIFYAPSDVSGLSGTVTIAAGSTLATPAIIGSAEVLNGGTLHYKIAHAGSVGDFSVPVTVNANSTIQLDQPGANGGGTQYDLGLLTLGGNLNVDAQTFNANFFFGMPSLVFADVSNDPTVLSTDATLNIFGVNPNAPTQLPSVNLATGITGNHTLTKAGNGNLIIGNFATSNYTGLNIAGGIVSVTLGNELPTASLGLTGGTLQLFASSGATVSNTTMATTVSADSTISIDQPQNGGAATYNFGTLSLGANTLTITQPIPGHFFFGQPVINYTGTTLTGNATLAVNGGTAGGLLTTNLGPLTGLFTLTKTGNGNLSIGVGSNYNGLTLNSGQVTFTDATQFPKTSLTLAGGALALAGTNSVSGSSNTLVVNDTTLTTTISTDTTINLSQNTPGFGSTGGATYNLGPLVLGAGLSTLTVGETTSQYFFNNGSVNFTSTQLNGNVTITGTSRTGAGTLLAVGLGAITGPYTITKTGSNSINPGSGSNYTGLIITSGLATITAASQFPANLGLNGGTLSLFASAGATVTNTSVATSVTANSTVSIDQPQAGGFATYNLGPLNLGAFTLTITQPTTGHYFFGQPIVNFGATTLSGNATLAETGGTAGNAPTNLLATSLGPITGSTFTLTKTGNGSLNILAGAGGNYAGLAISGGPVTVNDAGGFPTATLGLGGSTLNLAMAANLVAATGATTVSANTSINIDQPQGNGAASYNFGTLAIGANTLSIALPTPAHFFFGLPTVTFGATTLSGNAIVSTAGASGGFTLNPTIGPISGGSNSLTKTGAANLTLVGTNTYTGNTTVNGGTLFLASGSSVASGTVTVGGSAATSVAILAGTGNASGSVTVNGPQTTGFAGHLAPGTIVAALNAGNTIGTLNTGPLTLNDGSALDYLLGTPNGSTTSSVGSVSSLTAVNGVFTLLPSGGAVTLNLFDNNGNHTQGSLGAGTYELISYASANVSGDVTSSFNLPTISGDTFTVLAKANELDLKVTVVVTGPQNLFWSGGTPAWDVATTPNWNGGTAKFNQGDVVTFDDTVGAGSLTVTANTTVQPASVAVNGTKSYIFNGTGGIANVTAGVTTLTQHGTGSLTVSTVNTYTGATTIGTGSDSPAFTLTSAGKLASASVTVASGATANINGIFTATPAVTVAGTATLGANDTINAATGSLLVRTWGALNVSGNLTVAPVAVASHTSRTVLVTNGLTDTGTINLNNNDLVIHNGSASTVFSELKAGFNAGVGYWNGTSASGSINSNTATASDGKSAATDSRFLTTLGYRNGSAAFTFEAGSSSPMSTAATDVLVKYTYYGDADLNGTLNGSDYQQIDAGFGSQTTGSPLSGWSNGDFNYDGKINGSDFALIDNAMNQLAANPTLTNPLALIAAPASLIAAPADLIAAPAATSAVPEPTTLGLLGLGAMGLLGRRKRRHM